MYTIEKDIVFGAIKPSNTPTIGNYIGTIKNWIKFQKTHSCIFTISDLHLINSNYKVDEVAEKSMDMLTLIIATGLEGERNNLYIQSSVPQHSELAWYLYTFVVNNSLLPEVDKIIGERSKSSGYLDLLTAADYLLYQAKIIPIGYNKENFIQLARFIAEKFNSIFGDTLVLPTAYIDTYNSKVMGLQNLSEPMSRCNSSDENNIIYITDSVDKVAKKILAAKIEPNVPFVFEENNPAIFNLLSIYKGITEKNNEEIEKEFENLTEEQFKEAIITEINRVFQLIQMRYGILKKNPDYIRTIMNSNSSVSSYAASKTIDKLKKSRGIYF